VLIVFELLDALRRKEFRDAIGEGLGAGGLDHGCDRFTFEEGFIMRLLKRPEVQSRTGLRRPDRRPHMGVVFVGWTLFLIGLHKAGAAFAAT
jgi:hypothetical protein